MHNHAPKGYDCFMCTYSKGDDTDLCTQDDIVWQDERILAYVSPKWWPNISGNVIIIPREHFENIYDTPDELLAEMNVLAKKIAIAMKKSYGCEGTSLRQHNEPAGGQEAFHYHLHVMPRWKDDDLYISHKQSRFVSHGERKPYVEKLRKMLN